MEPKLITVLHDFETAFVEKGTYRLLQGEYAYGGTAIMAETESGEPAFVLSVYVEDAPLLPGEFWAKGWSENVGIADELVRRGIIERTGETARTGFVEAEGARLAEDYR